MFGLQLLRRGNARFLHDPLLLLPASFFAVGRVRVGAPWRADVDELGFLGLAQRVLALGLFFRAAVAGDAPRPVEGEGFLLGVDAFVVVCGEGSRLFLLLQLLFGLFLD